MRRREEGGREGGRESHTTEWAKSQHGREKENAWGAANDSVQQVAM